MRIEKSAAQRRCGERAGNEAHQVPAARRAQPFTGARAAVRARCRLQARHRGIALPSALMLASMMLTTSAVWLEASLALSRFDGNVHEHLRAAHAADGALALCVRDWRSGVAPVASVRRGVPDARSFDGGAVYEPVPYWPGSARAPQCVIEAAVADGSVDVQAYWITARGFGALESTQAWLELTIVRERGMERQSWRRIVSAPAAN
ncbi:hypothetical protein C0Z18_23530 [Trinickia dabaoshanensis]|uniref:PilX/PilW C-terminal domain-containing protein n=1 Tax=Trinickia dabaoshanensis TaxID=564714 RepID=A0A2N7VHB0_9BURK|nr:pilus assembly protein [Trinickia dabaoshanensis]PMS16529.1 hypothetical protein C0Z18_23530 [Trinickia dabaoshanensis]